MNPKLTHGAMLVQEYRRLIARRVILRPLLQWIQQCDERLVILLELDLGRLIVQSDDMSRRRLTTLYFREHIANEPEAKHIGVIDAARADEDGRPVELRVHFHQERTLSLEATSFERGIQDHITSIVEIIDSGERHIAAARLKHFEVFPLIGLLLLGKNLLVLMERAPLGSTHE